MESAILGIPNVWFFLFIDKMYSFLPVARASPSASR